MAVQKERKLRYNCYLLREGIAQPELALRAAYRPGGTSEMTALPAADDAPEGIHAYFSSRSEKVPPWAQALGSIFPGLSNALNMSNRLVIFLPVSGRIFAICFGYGMSTLDHGAIEPNFGLRFAARRLNPSELSEIRSRRIDATSRTQSVQVPVGADLRDLDVVLEGEFIRRLVGKLDIEGIDFPDIGAIVATDSVSFKAKTDLSNVQQVLASMLDQVANTSVRDELLFVDSLEPLRSSDPLVEKLETRLVRALSGDQRENPAGDSGEIDKLVQYILEFSPPDSISSEDAESIEVHRGKRVVEIDSLSLDALKDGIAKLGGRKLGRRSLGTTKMIALGEDGEPKSQLLPLRNWLIYEIGNEEHRYILTLGKWFALNENYTRRLNRDLARIKLVTDELSLATWSEGLSEGEYNSGVASSREDLALLDKVKIYSEDGDEIEACDLLSDGGHLIHVKKYTGSQTLSHLFSQGYVSAHVIAGDRVYREAFIEAVGEISPGLVNVAQAAPKIVTYAIGVTKNKALPGDLPTFSKVNLRDFANRLRGSQVEPTICRVQMNQ